MRITVNGTVAEVADGSSVGDLVRARVDDRRRVAVARNGEVVPRAEWDATPLGAADTVEVLAPQAGG
ncbi:MAG TPA: sulfur carrier protein ThiS [Micromonosporaceae bacterium]